MKLKDIIRAQKEITSAGNWATGRMPRNAFPMSKSGEKAYRLGNRTWRVVAFRALDLECRLLINFSAILGQYQAWLGILTAGDTKVVSQLEYHPTHCAWHVHAACDDLENVPGGIRRGPWLRRLKRGRAYVAKHPFDFGESDALTVAYRFYGMDRTFRGELL